MNSPHCRWASSKRGLPGSFLSSTGGEFRQEKELAEQGWFTNSTSYSWPYVFFSCTSGTSQACYSLLT